MWELWQKIGRRCSKVPGLRYTGYGEQRTKPQAARGQAVPMSASSQESGKTAGGGTFGSGRNTGKGGSKKGYVLLGGAVVVIAAGVLIWQGMFLQPDADSRGLCGLQGVRTGQRGNGSTVF